MNGNFYLGSTMDFMKRKATHLNVLKKNRHHSTYLQNAVNKHGLENFEIVIYQFCYAKDRFDLEQHYINTLKPKYNMSRSATAPMQGRKHSKVTIEKFKARLFKFGEAHHHYGKKTSEETKEKQRLKKLGTRRSEKTKRKMSNTAKKLNSISRIDRTKSYKKIYDDIGNIYQNLTEAAKLNKVSISTIYDNLKGRSLVLRNGRQIRYYEENRPFVDKSTVKLRHKGENSNLNKYSEKFIIEVKKDIKNGLSNKLIIQKYNLNKSTFYSIKNGKIWGI